AVAAHHRMVLQALARLASEAGNPREKRPRQVRHVVDVRAAVRRLAATRLRSRQVQLRSRCGAEEPRGEIEEGQGARAAERKAEGCARQTGIPLQERA